MKAAFAEAIASQTRPASGSSKRSDHGAGIDEDQLSHVSS
jgi:hypothetical protein